MASSSAQQPATNNTSPLLSSDDLIRLLAPHLDGNTLLDLLSACRTLRAVTGVEISPGANKHSHGHDHQHAARILEFHRRFGERLIVVRADVVHCNQEQFDALLALPGLRRLSVGLHSRITNVEAAAKASALHSLLLLHRCADRFIDISSLGQCRLLRELAIHGTPNNPGTSLSGIVLSHLCHCSRLKHLELKRCVVARLTEGLKDLAGERSAAAWSLESLLITHSTFAVQDLAYLAGLRSLRFLDLASNVLLTSVAPLGKCAALAVLTLTGCLTLTDVSGLDECKHLDTLYLTGCTELSDVTPLAGCPALRVLHLNRCSKLIDAGCLADCPKLELLNLRGAGVQLVPNTNRLRVLLN